MDDLILGLITDGAYKVRYFNADQAARLSGSPSALRMCLDAGLVECATVMCERPSPLKEHLLYWEPGDLLPRFESLASRCRLRPINPVCEQKIYFVTEKAVRLVGGVVPNVASVFQISHDLQVTEILATLREIDTDAADRWIGEDFFKLRHPGKLGDYLPDAAVFEHSGELVTAIEFGGQHYTPDRFREIHAACSKRRIHYSIW